MITTIQLREDTKKALLRLRERSETYEEIILNLIRLAKTQKKEQEELLIQECKEMAEENLRIAKEGEGTLMDGLDRNEKWEELEEEI